MPRETDESDILVAVLKKLRSDFGLKESTCFESVSPLAPELPTSGDFFLTVYLGDGSFDPELFEGGGEDQLTEEVYIAVTIWNRIHTDKANSSAALLRNVRRGLLPLKRKLLKSLAGFDPQVNGESVLRELVRPVTSKQPDYDKEKGLGYQVISFAFKWDWDLSEE